jgi:hypothetical protein
MSTRLSPLAEERGMPPRNDPVLDSGFPQEDHPARTGKLFPSALIWAGPLGVAVTLLLDMLTALGAGEGSHEWAEIRSTPTTPVRRAA